MHDSEFDIRSILGLIQRQIRSVMYITAIVIVLAGIYVFSLTPIYTATTLVLVDPNSKNVLSNTVEASVGSTINARVDSEVEILKSTVLLEEVALKANLYDDPEFGGQTGLVAQLKVQLGITAPQDSLTPEEKVKKVIPKLRAATTISRQGLTYLIRIAVDSENPTKAAELSRLYAQTYIANQLRNKVQSNLAARDILQARVVAASETLAQSERSFDQFLDSNLDRIVAETGRGDLESLKAQLETLEGNSLQAEIEMNTLMSQAQSGNWDMIGNSLQNEAITALNQQRAVLADSLERAAEGSDLQINLRRQLALLEDNLETTARQAVEGLQAEISANSNQAATFRDQIRTSVLGSELPAEMLTQIFAIQQESSIARDQYQQLLSSLRGFEAQAQLQLADSRIVSPASPPLNPSFPRKPLMLGLAGMLGLGLGLGVAFIREFYVGGFTSETQLTDVLNLKVASAAPIVSNSDSKGTLSAPVEQIIDAPLSVFSEGVRRLRAAIDHDTRESAKEKGTRIIMATSTVPGEGKTTTSLSLARTYAMSGQKTVLIDADMRKPSIARTLGEKPENGLRAYLAPPEPGEAPLTLKDVLIRDERGNLDVLPGAGRVNQPTDQLLAGARFGALLEELSEIYDVIIIDTPPLLPVVDGRYIAYHVDAVVMVVKWADTRQQDVRLVLPPLGESLKEGVSIFAFLNQQELARRGNYYRGYYQGYGYVSE